MSRKLLKYKLLTEGPRVQELQLRVNFNILGITLTERVPMLIIDADDEAETVPVEITRVPIGREIPSGLIFIDLHKIDGVVHAYYLGTPKPLDPLDKTKRILTEALLKKVKITYQEPNWEPEDHILYVQFLGFDNSTPLVALLPELSADWRPELSLDEDWFPLEHITNVEILEE